jgi:hypothetical protein
MVLGDGCDDRLGGVGEDPLGKVIAAKERQVVSVLEARDPGDLLVLSDVTCGPFAPTFGELGEAVLCFVRPGGDRRHGVQSHVLDGGRASPVGRFELGLEAL